MRSDLAGEPSFRQLLAALHDAWTNRGDEVAHASTRIREALSRAADLGGGTAFDRAAIEATVPEVVVIDSIQTMFDPDTESPPGSVGQVRDCAAAFVEIAKAGLLT